MAISLLEILHAAGLLKELVHFMLGPFRRAIAVCRRFLSAQSRERRELRFLHQHVTHVVRDFAGQAHALAQHGTTRDQRVDELRNKAQEALELICDELSGLMSNRIGKEVCVSLGTFNTTKSIVKDPGFQSLVAKRAAAQGTSDSHVLEDLARKAGGGGDELSHALEDRLLIQTRVRSKNTPSERKASGSLFWLQSKCTALEFFHERDPKDDPGVYCTKEDLRKAEPYARRNEPLPSEFFRSPRPEFWKWYRSVAVFPLRIIAHNNTPVGPPHTKPEHKGLIGFLWLDSLKPRAFRYDFESPGPRHKWPAAMSLVHAVGDAAATILAIELYFETEIIAATTGATPLTDGPTALPPLSTPPALQKEPNEHLP